MSYSSSISEALEDARRLRAEGRIDEAAARLEPMLAAFPDHLETLLELAQIALAQRRMDACLSLLDTATTHQPDDPELHFRRATVLQQLRRLDEARSAYGRAVELKPDHVPALLKLGGCCLATGDRDAAVRVYQGIVAITGPVGRALQDQRLPAAIRGDVELMHRTLQGQYRQLLELTRTYLRETYPAAELTRIDAAFQVLAGERQHQYDHPLQRPEFFFIPGLPPIPWFERDQFEWVARVEQAFPAVREELEALLADRGDFIPYLHGTQGQAAITPAGTDFSHLAGNLSWSAYHLHKGHRIDDHCARCPETAALMDSLPLPVAEGWMPETFFSVLAPGEHIIPHLGQMNGRLTIHLGLIIPPDCGIRVGEETRGWEEGRVLAFDDSFLHEAWNRSDRERAVFIFEAWHPDMKPAEMDGVRHFLETRSRWLRQIGAEQAGG